MNRHEMKQEESMILHNIAVEVRTKWREWSMVIPCVASPILGNESSFRADTWLGHCKVQKHGPVNGLYRYRPRVGHFKRRSEELTALPTGERLLICELLDNGSLYACSWHSAQRTVVIEYHRSVYCNWDDLFYCSGDSWKPLRLTLSAATYHVIN